jgi:hypothetical protein
MKILQFGVYYLLKLRNRICCDANISVVSKHSWRGSVETIRQIITLAYKPSVLNPSFSVFFVEKSSLRYHRRLRVQRAPVTYSVQFQNGRFSLSDLIYISHSFVEFSKNCDGFQRLENLKIWTQRIYTI